MLQKYYQLLSKMSVHVDSVFDADWKGEVEDIAIV